MTLRVQNVALDAGGKRILQGIDFELLPGKVAAVIGANGAGKSSLLRILSAELPPAEGSVRMDGRPLSGISRGELARRLAVLPQHSTLDFPFLACEVVEMGRIPHATGKSANRRLVSQVIERLQLSPLRDRTYTTLSGGEKQRVQIARVLCQLWDCLEDGYLLFDEPTAPLDLSHQLAFLQIARELAARRAGVLLVMHDINLAVRCADSIAVMKEGRILAAGGPNEVVTPANIRAAFDVDVTIVETADGAPLIYTKAIL